MQIKIWFKKVFFILTQLRSDEAREKKMSLQIQAAIHFSTTQAKTKFHRSDLKRQLSEDM